MEELRAFLILSLPAVALGCLLLGLDSRYSWTVKINYRIGNYFYRARNNRKLRQRAAAPAHARQPALSARPSAVGPMSSQESRFFFLHEVELNAGVGLALDEAGGVVVSKKDYRKLEEYFGLAASKPKATPHAAFAHHGMALRVES